MEKIVHEAQYKLFLYSLHPTDAHLDESGSQFADPTFNQLWEPHVYVLCTSSLTFHRFLEPDKTLYESKTRGKFFFSILVQSIKI